MNFNQNTKKILTILTMVWLMLIPLCRAHIFRNPFAELTYGYWWRLPSLSFVRFGCKHGILVRCNLFRNWGQLDRMGFSWSLYLFFHPISFASLLQSLSKCIDEDSCRFIMVEFVERMTYWHPVIFILGKRRIHGIFPCWWLYLFTDPITFASPSRV